MAGEELPRVEVSSLKELRNWLIANHATSASAWLVIWKKADTRRHVPYDVVVEELLCFGWVDSLPRKLDEQRSMLLISPRKPGSNWSRVNRDRVEKLIAEGRMSDAGMLRVTQAKADGRWQALDAVEALETPEDLLVAFQLFPNARENFEAFPRSVKRGILEWLLNAKRPETRAKRVEETARLAAQNIRANQWRQS